MIVRFFTIDYFEIRTSLDEEKFLKVFVAKEKKSDIIHFNA
jgi:hypothetical protein